MRRFLLVLTLILATPLTCAAGFDPAPLEQVGAHYRSALDGLDSYAVTVRTDKVAEMIGRMTANLPPEVPRPPVPTLTKYWSRVAGGSVVLAGDGPLLPTMRDMVEKYSRQFAIDLPFALLPENRSDDRDQFYHTADATVTDNRLEGSRRLTIRLGFATPVDLAGAFFSENLSLPQKQVSSLTFDLDPDRHLLLQLEVATADQRRVTMEVRHTTENGRDFPTELLITLPDGSLDDHFRTELEEVGDFWLPREQNRTIRRSNQVETIRATFEDYRLNVPLPPQVLERLTAP